VIRAIQGGASQPESSYINLKTFFLYLYQQMKKTIDRINKREHRIPSTGRDTNEGDNDSLQNSLQNSLTSNQSNSNAALHQIPVLFLPKRERNNPTNLEKLLNNSVLYRCSPPPAPERPYINEVRDDCVTLEWFNPPFQGISPAKYKIFVRNNTRNYRKWAEIYYPGDITKTVFTVHNLPMGVSCEFKVSAFNCGGWSALSDETDGVIPGEDKIMVIPKRLKWRRLQQSGILGILDYLTVHSFAYEEQEHGLQIILNFLETKEEDPLKSMKLVIKLINRLFYNFHYYCNNPIILSLCFKIVGWCLKHKKLNRKIRQYCLTTPPPVDIPVEIPTAISTSSGMTTSSSEMKENIEENGGGVQQPSSTGSSSVKKITKNKNASAERTTLNTKNLFHFIELYSEKYYYHDLLMNAIQFLKQDDLLKYFQLKEKEKEIKIMLKKGAKKKLQKEEEKGEEKKETTEQPENKKISYLMDFSIPGRHEILFPADDSEDDLAESSGDDEDDEDDDDIDDLDAELGKDEKIQEKLESKQINSKKEAATSSVSKMGGAKSAAPSVPFKEPKKVSIVEKKK
jgi:hypothetical protein